MFGPKIEFKAQIKRGTTVGHDWGYFKWPSCRAPGGKHEAEDPDMVFDASYDGHCFSLRARGYGVLDKPNQYGNGSITTFDVAGLVMADIDREKVVNFLRKEKQAVIDKARGDLAKLESDLAELAVTNTVQ